MRISLFSQEMKFFSSSNFEDHQKKNSNWIHHCAHDLEGKRSPKAFEFLASDPAANFTLLLRFAPALIFTMSRTYCKQCLFTLVADLFWLLRCWVDREMDIPGAECGRPHSVPRCDIPFPAWYWNPWCLILVTPREKRNRQIAPKVWKRHASV